MKANPLSAFALTANASYERVVASNQSLQTGFFYTRVVLGGIGYSGWGITPEYRVYFAGNKQALDGVYFAPFVRYRNFRLLNSNNDSRADFSSIGGGVLVGMEKTLSGNFIVDLFLGPQYHAPSFKNRSGNEDFEDLGFVRRVGLRAGVALGFAF